MINAMVGKCTGLWEYITGGGGKKKLFKKIGGVAGQNWGKGIYKGLEVWERSAIWEMAGKVSKVAARKSPQLPSAMPCVTSVASCVSQGSPKKTEPIGRIHRYIRGGWLWESAHVIMELEKSHDLPSASQRARKAVM